MAQPMTEAALPDAVQPDAAPLPRAGLFARLSSLLYECLLLLALLIIAGFAAMIPGALFFHDPGRLLAPRMQPLMMAYDAVVLGAYFTWYWMHGGQTLAMKTWRLRLVTRLGAPLSLPQAVARYLTALGLISAAMALLALRYRQHTLHDRLMIGLWGALAPFLWAVIDPQRLFLHDRLCGTRIVRLPRPFARKAAQPAPPAAQPETSASLEAAQPEPSVRLGAAQQEDRRQGE